MYSYTRFEADRPGPSCQTTSVAEDSADYAASKPTPTPQPDDDELARLSARLRQNAQRISQQTAVFIDRLARFDEFNGWRLEGARSCSQWLSWRCGFGEGSAREHVRVARALKALPLVRSLFRKGRLSFSKVRAITRIANAENEAELVDMALSSAAHDLEHRVRQYRDARSAEATRDENRRADWQYQHRYLSYRWGDDGCLHLHARLTPEQGTLFLQSLRVTDERVGTTPFDVLRENEPVDGPVQADTEQSTTAQDDTPVRTPSQRRADLLYQMAANNLTCESDGRTSDRYQVVVNVDLETLQEDSEPASAQHPSQDCPPATAGTHRSPGNTARFDPGPAVSAETAKRLSCDTSKVDILSSEGEPLAIGRKSPIVPNSMRRALLFRDEHRCQFPGCNASHGLDAHHVKHWSAGGNTDLDNLVSLCAFHHRLLHEGGYTVKPNPDWTKPALREQPGRSSGTPQERSRGNARPNGNRRIPRFLFSDQRGTVVRASQIDTTWSLSPADVPADASAKCQNRHRKARHR